MTSRTAYAQRVAEVAAMRELVQTMWRLAPGREFADQALRVDVHVSSPALVRRAAELMLPRDVPVTVGVLDDGRVATRAVVGFGIGSDPESPIQDFAYAALLTIANVTDPDDGGDLP